MRREKKKTNTRKNYFQFLNNLSLFKNILEIKIINKKKKKRLKK